MRTFTFALAIALPFGLAACNAEPEQPEIIEDAQEEAVGPIEEEIQQEFGTETTGYGVYDTDTDGLLSEDEWTTGGLTGDFATYDLDQSGYLDENEYGAYESSLTM